MDSSFTVWMAWSGSKLTTKEQVQLTVIVIHFVDDIDGCPVVCSL